MEVHEYRGIRRLVAAELLEDTDTALVYGTPFHVAGISTLVKNTSTSTEIKYYDNMEALVIEASGADVLTLDTSAMLLETVGILTGQEYDTELGMLIEGVRNDKFFALGYITKRTDGSEIFVWRHKGKFSIPEETHKTEDDSTDSMGQSLQFTGITTKYKFIRNGKPAKAINIDTSRNPLNEDEFFSKVQTPDTIIRPNTTPVTVTFDEKNKTVKIDDEFSVKGGILSFKDAIISVSNKTLRVGGTHGI